jgi:peptidoglycan/LPS O-acetylase OafA/YrhL
MLFLQSINPHVSRSIDTIRGAAALGVIWGHSMYDSPPMNIVINSISIPIELNGGLWVWIFLPVSGYLVGYGFFSGGYALSIKGCLRFIYNRALRILPLAYCALFICASALAMTSKNLPENFIRQLLLSSHNNDMSLVNGFWTVAAEFHFYLAAGLLIVLCQKSIRIGGATGGILLLAGSIYLSDNWIQYVGDNQQQPRTFIGNIHFFIFGILLSVVKCIRIEFARLIKFTVIFLLILLTWWLQNYEPSYFWGWGGIKLPLGGTMVLAMIIVSIALLVVPKENSGATLHPEHKIYMPIRGLQWVGFLCYGVYVWQGVLGTFNGLFFNIPLGIPRLFLLLLSIPLAYISYEIIEKPILKLKLSHYCQT